MNTTGEKTSNEQSENSPPEEERKLPKLHDSRQHGEWWSAYPTVAKWWICIELVYLLVILLAGISLMAISAVSRLPIDAVPILPYRPLGNNPPVLFWTSVFTAGTLGGAVMALKWQYHCVAKKLWHADRRVWRITTPLLSGVISTFVLMLIASEFISFFSVDQVTKPLGGVSLAFVLGLFSDNILAALQNFALKSFGTLRDKVSPNRENAGDGE